ncbi:LamG-like jellyroll fold domain-containing protein, partial [Agrococcus terreus]
KLPLAVSVPLTVGMAFTSAVMPVSAMADQTTAVVPAAVQQPAPAEVPAADILDVDFAEGTAADTAQNLPITEHGNPQIELDPALDRNAVTFDGESALQYPFGDQYEQMTDSFSVECVFRYNGDLPSSGQTNLCANKEAGGFAVAMFADRLTFELHTGSYQNIGVQIEPNQWYHAVATFDGADQTARLYVNGELAAEVETVGSEMTWPANTGAHNMTLGADS